MDSNFQSQGCPQQQKLTVLVNVNVFVLPLHACSTAT